ncbi:MAG: hypothetical protein IJ480_01945 [Clostridia bacterium]|nr:hypothetical protein [Clostridia bacterium]
MKPYDTFRENLHYISRLADSLDAMQDAQFAQIAGYALRKWKNYPDTDRIAALYLTGDPDADPGELSLSDARLCTADFARFCRHFKKGLPAEGLLFTGKNRPAEEDFEDAADETEADDALFPVSSGTASGGRTAYMQNSYTDRAWRQFARHLPDMTAEYFSSYPAVCEEVYNGRCPYCILPLYTSADGQLVSFRKLIGKYDLKICLETEVEMADESVMRFALLRRRLSPGNLISAPEFMDISFVLPENSSAGELIAACEALGADVTAVYTIPLEYADRTQEFCLELHLPQANLAGLSVFLEASQLRYTLIGMYPFV